MSAPFDPRVTPARGDLAAAHLRGRVEAQAYRDGTDHVVIAGAAPLRGAPRGDAALASEALFGEVFTVYEERGGWAWGQLRTDGYVGYLPGQLIVPGAPEPTHRVAALRTHLYAGPDIKGPVLALLSLNTPLGITGVEGAFARAAAGGYVTARHLAAAGEWAGDHAAVAERLVGTPYLWGGRTSVGLDCSALVQLCLASAGITAPRDSDMQEREVGRAIAAGEVQRGDLAFWEGHVAILVDTARIVHANAYHMETVVEPLADLCGRVGPARAFKRPARG